MNITVYGSGYVGLVAAACFAKVGNHVVCMDIDAKRIADLNQGIIPIYEPGLTEMVLEGVKQRTLQFTTDVKTAVLHGECQFIAVGTPPDEDGKADLKYVMSVAHNISLYREDYTIIINKSTVPIGTADRVSGALRQGFEKRQKAITFDVVSNPEFLKEGAAIQDFCFPDRIVLGIGNARVEAKLRRLYQPFCRNENTIMMMDVRSAELTKYAANAMLATKISFMNEMANLAEKVGADIEYVRKGIGSDPRIGMAFTYPGCGYGGSCFGKDIQALIHTAKEHEMDISIIEAVEKVNANQKNLIVDKIEDYFQGNIEGKVFAVWGLAFKPETDDMRDAPSVVAIHALRSKGAKIQAYDPKATMEAKKILGDENIRYGHSPEEVLHNAHALIIFTEWSQFKQPNFREMRTKLLAPVIFDGRNIYDLHMMKTLGFTYFGIGRGCSLQVEELEHDFHHHCDEER